MNQASLTILTLFGGHPALLAPFFKALERLEKPALTDFVAIHNSPDKDFGRRLAAFGCTPVHYPETLAPCPGSELSREAQIRKAEHCARLYHFSKSYVHGKNLLLLEHDVLPSPYALTRLFENRKKARADLISGSVLSRITSQHLAWRLKQRFPENGFKRVWVTGGLKRVQATGFGFLLMDTSVFKTMPLEAARAEYPFWGCDLHAGAWAHKNNLRWFVDGSARCRHMGPDGQTARQGRLENVRAGSYLGFLKKSPDRKAPSAHAF